MRTPLTPCSARSLTAAPSWIPLSAMKGISGGTRGRRRRLMITGNLVKGYPKRNQKEIDSKDWGKIVTHNPDGEYGHIHHKKVSKYVTMILKKEDRTDQLVYFGTYTSKKNKAKLENEKKLSKKDYDKKLDIIQLYSSQSKVMDHLHHMLPYENWKPYSNWGKIE